MCMQFRCAPLHTKKALAIFRELITTTTTTRTTTRVAFGDRHPGPKILFDMKQFNSTLIHICAVLWKVVKK